MSLCLRVFLVSLLFICVFTEDDFVPLNIIIEHSFDGGKSFKPKGSITSWSNEGIPHLLKEPLLTVEEQSLLMNLALSNSMYVIRAYIKPNSFILMSSCQARHLLASDGKLALILSIDASGSPIAISAVAKNHTSVAEVGSLGYPSKLSTIVYFQKPSLAIGPDTQEYLAKMERQREEKLRQEQMDNRGFFAKYWVYIVLIFIIYILIRTADPNTPGGQ
ncbi:hypothetical protein Aperf_G00000067886 [Anoplocephala perfoliata]